MTLAPPDSCAPMVEHAIYYARRGWPVFPCKPTNKAPFFRGGFHAATTDEAKICKWWGYWPKAMIGVPMGPVSGVWAVDPDPPKTLEEPDGREIWAGLIQEHGELPATHTEVTPRGGQHIVFKWDPARPVTNSPGALAKTNVDVRGEGGYIIVAPSVCVGDGTPKNVAGQYSAAGNFFHFAEAPNWVYELVLARPEPKPAPEPEQATTSSSPRSSEKSDDDRQFWRKINDTAFQNLGAWVPEIFGSAAEYQPNTGAWRISSKALGRELEEDLSIHPDGVTDFGVWDIGDERQGKRTAIDIVIEYGRKRDAVEAALWLSERCGVDPVSLGWQANGAGSQQGRQQGPQQSPPGAGQAPQQSPSIFELFWHGTKYDRETRAWLVKDMIPETGQGLASGQWGTAKTFVGMDLAAEVMLGGTFAGRDVVRKGGVLFVAAEGASEIPVRLEGLVEQKLRPNLLNLGLSEQSVTEFLDALPFAWIEDCPNLQSDNDFARLLATIKQAEKNIRDQFNLPLVLIEIDTLSATGNFKDANDAAEGQRIMNRLGEISRQIGAFVLAIDHFGKAVETGTRGSSAKEAAADVVLALLADREISGTISNTRMALRKLRGGKVGEEMPFELRVVNLAFLGTTCVVEWKPVRTATQASTATKDRWPQSLRIFKAALETAISTHGKAMHPFDGDELTVRAVPFDKVRAEFVAAYPAEGDAKDKADAKRKAFKRALERAREKELLCSREISGIDYLWLVQPATGFGPGGPDKRAKGGADTTADRPDTP